MARTSTRRRKGCGLCKPYKLANYGDAERMPFAVRRQYGKKRRLGRGDIGE